MKNTVQPKYSNSLVNETSPYLLQHAHNPVNWYPWSDKILEKAKKENKLIIVSIGYSACHWCHVMERESFESEDVAQIMNQNYISVKVDREERPDVDNIYMDAVHLMGKQGGWPLNCIALPDGRPVYGGTYFPKESWLSVLNQIQQLYENEEEKLLEFADKLQTGLNQQAILQIHEKEFDFKQDDMEEMVQNWKQNFDSEWGGSQGAPKFPMPNGLLFLLQYYYFTRDKEIKDYIELTLDRMSSGGIYDHLGGGFARYSTDEYWKVPHFEKMLYDNAQLLSVYSQAYKLYKKEKYKHVVYETYEFLNRELMSVKGAYYAALDADSEGVEGKFYVWSYDEIIKLLGRDAEIFNSYYSISKKGNWEHDINVIHNEVEIEQLEKKFGKAIDELKDIIDSSKKVLFEARSKRIRPGTDTKILASWNALAISGLVDAYKAFGDQRFLNRALKTVDYFKQNHISISGEVFRMLKENSENISGFLDDYALLARSFLDLYEVTFDELWLLESRKIVETAADKFYDKVSRMFNFHMAGDESLFADKQEIQDNVIPASNSAMANVLFKLAIHFDNADYNSKAEQMLSGVYPNLSKYGAYFSNWGLLLNQFVFLPPEIVITGDDCLEINKNINSLFLYANVAGSSSESKLPQLEKRFNKKKTIIYVCKNRVCNLPVTKIEDALNQIEEFKIQ